MAADHAFIETILMTYTEFTSPDTFIEKLISVYDPPEGINDVSTLF